LAASAAPALNAAVIWEMVPSRVFWIATGMRGSTVSWYLYGSESREQIYWPIVMGFDFTKGEKD